MKLVLKRWFINTHFGESTDMSALDIIKKYSIVYQCDNNSYGKLYAKTPKAVKFIKTDAYSGNSCFDFVPQSACVLIDETWDINKQVNAYNFKNRKSEKKFVLEEVQAFLEKADIWQEFGFDKNRKNKDKNNG